MGRNQGFSLIELAIVIGVIGILSAIAVPQYMTYTTRSQVTADSLPAKVNLQHAIAQYVNEYNVLPADFIELGKVGFLQDNNTPHTPSSLATKAISSVDWNGSQITLTFSNTYTYSEIAGKTLVYTLSTNQNGQTAIDFNSSTIPKSFLPKQ